MNPDDGIQDVDGNSAQEEESGEESNEQMQAMKAMVKKKLKAVHQEVISPPGQ